LFDHVDIDLRVWKTPQTPAGVNPARNGTLLIFFQTLPVRGGCLVERQVSKFEQVRPKLFLEAFEFVRLQSDPTTRPAWRRLIAEAAAEGRVLSPREEQHGID
jgi:hypothetical protein